MPGKAPSRSPSTGESTKKLEDGLMRWVEGRGFPLETLTAKSLAKVGFEVSRGALYADPVTEETREIDVFAYLRHRSTIGTRSIAFTILAECKRVPDKAWVLFSRSHAITTEIPVFDFQANSLGWSFLSKLNDSNDKALEEALQETDWFSYDLREGPTDRKDSQDSAQIALKQVRAAALARTKLYEGGKSAIPDIAEIIVPVVVTGGPLFDCAPGPDDHPQLRRTEHGVFGAERWGWTTSYPPFSAHVVTPAGLPELAAALYRDAKSLERYDAELEGAGRND